MALVVKNNLSAASTLNKLNQNNGELAKSLKKVSSGMRITGAVDGASEYSIGKGMEVLVRALGQDIDNTKTGRNLVNTAEGGIQEIINLLREMKEKALDSANDHNSDIDRAIIQKDFSGRMDAITEIAATTNYNGRLLLNGDYPEPVEKMVHIQIPRYNTRTITAGPPSVTRIDNGNGTYTIVQNNSITNLMSNFSPLSGAGTRLDTPVTDPQGNSRYRYNGGYCDLAYIGNSGAGWSWPVAMGQAQGTSTQRNQMAVQADFSGMNLNGGTLPGALDQQGFSIVCGGCSQYINFKFDANSTSSSLSRSGSRSEYTIGVQNVTSANDLAKAIFDGIASTSYSSRQGYYTNVDADSSDNVLLDGDHQVRMAKNPSGGGYVFLKTSSPSMGFMSEGTILGTTNNPNALPPGVTVVTGPTTYTITDVTYDEHDELRMVPGRPLIIHTGPRANQYLPVYINSMHPIALGVHMASVDSRMNATLAIDLLDKALEYALNENTRMGAYQVRLNETEEALVAEEENTNASMSTMQDADMAKEMATYTKNNVLTQSAQSMLSQANQNVGGVLDLLQ